MISPIFLTGEVISQPTTLTHDILRGPQGRCPVCSGKTMFRAFLKVADACSVCGEEFYHHRADDSPAYCVIVIVGHILVPLVHIVEKPFEPPYWVHVALWIPGARASERPVGRTGESYGAAKREMLPGVEHRQSRYLNNRCANSHRSTRQRERRMQGFTSPGHAQRFLAAYRPIAQHFLPRRHLLSASEYRQEMAKRFKSWTEITGTELAT